MKTDLYTDALDLVKSILASIDKDDDHAIVNIARNEQSTYLLDGIARVFGYKYDSTPKLLQKHGVIEAANENKWYVENVDGNDEWVTKILPEINFVDPIFIRALEKEYLEDNEIPKYYYEATFWGDIPNVYSWGPKEDKHAAVLVSVDALNKFKDKFETTNNKFSSPISSIIVDFDETSGEIKINGELKAKIRKNTDQFELCKLLLKNEASKKKVWEWEIVLEKWHMDNLEDLSGKRMKVYRAAREINKKIAQTSEYKKLIIYTTKTVQVNSIFK
ncbi:MAG: hypothetical protein Q8P26_00655 [Candidatus Levybacteria bacterium]|nr:hypothetical protein [Candidatus Levybacteria bacterium]